MINLQLAKDINVLVEIVQRYYPQYSLGQMVDFVVENLVK
jgi:hypothetical protein